MRTFRKAVAVACFTIILVTSVQADWTVNNNHKERFTITYWSQGKPNTKWEATINPGQTRQLKLGMDKHMVQLRSAGGDSREFAPVALDGLNTKLSEMVTRDGKHKNGATKYKYMNQDGFYEKKGK